jgi:N-acetylmuramoyl-L-alanine amidase
MIEQLDDDVRMVATPARQAHLYVLGSRTIPSVLLEMGFLSNRQDEALLDKPAYRHVLVRAIGDAIDDYFATIKDPAART